jgi:hypothetical protein
MSLTGSGVVLDEFGNSLLTEEAGSFLWGQAPDAVRLGSRPFGYQCE